MSPWTEFETLVNKRIKLFRKRLWTLTEWGFELHCEKDLEAHVQTWELRCADTRLGPPSPGTPHRLPLDPGQQDMDAAIPV